MVKWIRERVDYIANDIDVTDAGFFVSTYEPMRNTLREPTSLTKSLLNPRTKCWRNSKRQKAVQGLHPPSTYVGIPIAIALLGASDKR